MSMAKSFKKLEAQKLRKLGMSVKFISKTLGVSKGSVSVWCSDIKLTKQQTNKLKQNSIAAGHKGRMLGAMVNKQKKITCMKKMKELAENEIKQITKRDLLMLGIGLYWGEGAKTCSRFEIINSDPYVIKTTYKFIVDILKVPESDIRLRIQINKIHEPRIDKVLDFWKHTLNMKSNQIQKPYFINIKPKKIYGNYDLYYGVARLKVIRGSNLAYKMIGYIDTIKSG